MAFAARKALTLTATLPRLSRASFTVAPRVCQVRAFSLRPASSPLNTIRAITKQPLRSPKRSYQQGPSYAAPTPSLGARALYGGAIFGGTLLGINLIFNRTTREDGGMPDYERSYLNNTFLHTAIGLGTIATAARALHVRGWSYRLMATNPWVVIGGGLALSIGSMMVCTNTDPSNKVQKYGSWTVFNLSQAALLAPLYFTAPALLARAGLYTVGMMGSIAFVGATAKQEQYLYLGGPLLAGCAVVILSGFAPLVLPATSVRMLTLTDNLWLYGGLAVFGGFTLYDVQKILHHARLVQQGRMRPDAVNESISLELDFINIFVRLITILGRSNNRK